MNNCSWAVTVTRKAKNNGVYKEWKEIIATFLDPFTAQDYIDKCLPAENKDKFEVISI